MKKLIALLMLLAIPAMAQQKPIFYDYATGQILTITNEVGNTNANFGSINVGNLSITTNGITVTNNFGWEDLRFPVGVAAPVNASADVAYDTAENALIYSAGVGGAGTNIAGDHCFGVAQMPHSWRTNSAVSCHVHFIQKNTDENNMWYMRWRFQPLGGVTNSAWNFTGPATNHYAYNGTNIHQMANFTNILLNGEESSIFDWKIYMLGTAVSNDITFKEFDIHYQVEKPTGERFGL